MAPGPAWSATAAAHDERTVGLVVEPLNVFTGASPSVAAVELFIVRQALDRNDDPVGPAVPQPSGMASYRTLSGRVVFPALDRLPGRGAVPVLELRFGVDAPGLIAHPGDLDLTFGLPGTGPVLKRIALYPAPDYLFPAHVIVLRGVVTGHQAEAPLLVRAVPPVPAGPADDRSRDQALTSYAYLGRSVPTTRTDLGFSLGLRSNRPPDHLEVVDTGTGATVATAPTPASPADLIVINL